MLSAVTWDKRSPLFPVIHLHTAGALSTSQRLHAEQTRPTALPAMRMTALSAGSKTLPLPPEPPPRLRLRCVFPRFQGSVSPGLGELLPPLEPSSAIGCSWWSSPDMASSVSAVNTYK